jgi:hypothetical protein
LALTSPELQAQVKTPRDLLTVNSLVVLPIEFNDKTRNLETEASTMDSTLQEAAKRELDLEIIERPSRVAQSQADALAAARASGADGVLVTQLESFIERSGSAVGGDPGTVSFRMFVLRTSDQREIWSTTYHFHDEALAFNLFKVRDRLGRNGAGFRRAGDVLVEGFASALKDFSVRRQEQFIVKSGRSP